MDSFSQPYSFGLSSGASQQPAQNAGRKLLAFVLREFIDGVASLRTQDLIANLLDLNAIEQFIGRRERCDVGGLLRQSLERNRLAASRKRIVFLIGIYGNLWTQADPAVLRQIFDKVVSNAIMYSPPNSTIQAHALLEDGRIVINVRDQGVGIHEERRQRLFEKFAQLLACPSGAPCSAGVRLTIVKKLAETLSGSVRWRSALGAGSTFTLKLPVSTGHGEIPGMPDAQLLTRKTGELPEAPPWSRN